jgi:hypothetical protein
MNAGMAASAQHESKTQASLGIAPGGTTIETPQTVDDISVKWSGQSVHPAVTPGNDVGPVVGTVDDLTAG